MVGHSLYWLKGKSHSYQNKVHFKKENKVINMLNTGKLYNKEYKIRTWKDTGQWLTIKRKQISVSKSK